jgi:GTP-binding protein HflX
LDEIREADILLHVVDISHPSFEEHIGVVNETLKDINASNKPTLLVFNKIDLLESQLKATDEDGEDKIGALKATFLNKKETPAVFISAANKENIDELKNKLFELVKEKHLSIFPNFLQDEVYIGSSVEIKQED